MKDDDILVLQVNVELMEEEVLADRELTERYNKQTCTPHKESQWSNIADQSANQLQMDYFAYYSVCFNSLPQSQQGEDDNGEIHWNNNNVYVQIMKSWNREGPGA